LKATYNITDDRLKAWFDERLSKENYDRMRRHGFTFWHGRKCFAAKWSPGAADLLKELGQTIEQDDTPDDVETRVERFQGYAQAGQEQAENSEQYLNERANTERRRQNALNGIEKGLSEAEHWQSRIEGAIRHAQYKERPDVIARRIEGIEKDKRREEKHKAGCEKWLKHWTAEPITEKRAIALSNYDNSHSRCYTLAEYPRIEGASTYEGAMGLYSALTGHIITPEQAQAFAVADHKHAIERADRWIAHLENRLLYERACLEAAGGIVGGTGAAPLNKDKFQKGGAVMVRGEWRIITKVNQKTIEVYYSNREWMPYAKVDRTCIQDVKSPEQTMKDLPHLQLPKLTSNQKREANRIELERERAERRTA
jgi:hypothetical protein